MFQNIIVKIVAKLLSKDLTLKNRGLLITTVLDRLSMLPLKSIITVNDNGSLVIRDKELDYEEMNLIHESAKALKDNRVYQLIQDEVLFRAFTFGLNHSTNFEQIYCSKMAVWWGMEQSKLLNLLAEKES
jgi:hypothetical protein